MHGQTRWNARYDAICTILELKEVWPRFEHFLTLNVTEPSVREAVIVSVSRHGFKFKWVEQKFRESMKQVCCDVHLLRRAWLGQASGPEDRQGTAVVTVSDDDYGYGERVRHLMLPTYC